MPGIVAAACPRRQWPKCRYTLRSRHGSQSGGARLRRAVHLRVRLRGGAFRAAAPGADGAVVRVCRVRRRARAAGGGGRPQGARAARAEAARARRHDRHPRLARRRGGPGAGTARQAARGARPRRTAVLDLLGRVRTGGGRRARGPPRDHALALRRSPRRAISRHPRRTQCAVRGRRQCPHLGRFRGGARHAAAPGAPRLRAEDRQSGGAAPGDCPAPRGRPGAVRAAAGGRR